MTFNALSAGASVFLDANVLLFHFAADPKSGTACTDLVKRIERQELTGITSTHVVSEVAHRLMTIEALRRSNRRVAGIAVWLRNHPSEVQQLTEFRQALQRLPGYGIQVLTIPADLLDAAAAISPQTGLLHNDALVVAMMQLHGLTNLASADTDFDRVPGITRYAPV